MDEKDYHSFLMEKWKNEKREKDKFKEQYKKEPNLNIVFLFMLLSLFFHFIFAPKYSLSSNFNNTQNAF